MGGFRRLGIGLVEVDHVQLVEAPGLDPDIVVLIPGGNAHQIQIHSSRQAIAVLMVGVVASQLGPARRSVQMHLPSRTKITLKFSQSCAPAHTLPGQHCF